MNHQETLTEYLAGFVDNLWRTGVQEVVISPGSRSTPLAILFSEHELVNVYMNVDERSAGFFALGLAKASNRPVALLCTSGTAAANYYPAVIEAALSRVPLVVLTADRPHELRDVGAPQAIDQIRLYGQHTKWYTDMPIPDADSIHFAKMAAVRAVKEACSLPQGPVHLNFPLREPLMPKLDPSPFTYDNDTPTRVVMGEAALPLPEIESLVTKWGKAKRGIIICGELSQPYAGAAILALADKLGFPVLADPLSQLRSEAADESMVIDSYDAILKSEDAARVLKPELIIRFGALPVSKPLTLFLKQQKGMEHIVIDGGGGWRDPYHLGTDLIYGDEKTLCVELCGKLRRSENRDWLILWKKLDSIAKDTIASFMIPEQELMEGKAIYELVDLLPEDSALFVGSSMPIRDIDTFFHQTGKQVTILSNRGANGIDGVVSTALGASVHFQPLFLVIGDLSFYHDMNGLLAAKMHKLNMTVILLNNDGGGIFSYLPQKDEPKHFEVLFGTPTGLNFEHAARLYDGRYTKVVDWAGYRSAVMEAAGQVGLHVIEVPTDREKSLQYHRQIWSQISRGINNFLQGVE